MMGTYAGLLKITKFPGKCTKRDFFQFALYRNNYRKIQKLSQQIEKKKHLPGNFDKKPA